MSNWILIFSIIIGILILLIALLIFIFQFKKKYKSNNCEKNNVKNDLTKKFYKNYKIIKINEINNNHSGVSLACGVKKFKKLDNKIAIKNIEHNKNKKIKKRKLGFCISEKRSTVVIAPPGSGKTQALLLPTIYFNIHCADKPCMIITDPKPEIINYVYNDLLKQDYQIINISTISPATSTKKFKTEFWNPLDNIIKLHKKLITENYKNKQQIISDITVEINDVFLSFEKNLSSNEKYWVLNGIILVKFFLCYLLFLCELNEIDYNKINFSNIIYNLTIKDVNELLKIVKWLNKLPKTKYKTLELITYFLQWSTERDEVIKSYISSILSKINIINQTYYSLLASRSTFNIDDVFLSKRPWVFFLTINTSSTSNEAESILLNLYLTIINKKINYYKKTNSEFKNKIIWWLIDEAGNIPKLDFLPAINAFGRSDNIFSLSIFQSYDQIKEIYSDNLLSASEYKLFFNHDNFFLSEKICKLVGQTKTQRNNSITSINNLEPEFIANIPLFFIGLWTFKRMNKQSNFYYCPVIPWYMITNVILAKNIKTNDIYDLSKFKQDIISFDDLVIKFKNEDKKVLLVENKQLEKLEHSPSVFEKKWKINLDNCNENVIKEVKKILNNIKTCLINLWPLKEIEINNKNFIKITERFNVLKSILKNELNDCIINQFILSVEQTKINIFYNQELDF